MKLARNSQIKSGEMQNDSSTIGSRVSQVKQLNFSGMQKEIREYLSQPSSPNAFSNRLTARNDKKLRVAGHFSHMRDGKKVSQMLMKIDSYNTNNKEQAKNI